MNAKTNEGLAINADRLWASIMEMAKIAATEKGGNCRLALSDDDKEGRDLFVRWCEEAGMTCTVDKMGNIFARRPGRDGDAKPVSTGSHLDTQPTGGKFDGVYGVLAGLEVVRCLNDAGIETEAPMEVICWTNEEGARFAPAMIGSGVFAGEFALDYAHAQEDADGNTMGGELDRIGYLGPEEPGGHALGHHFEAHIEQGPILEAEKKPVGVVTGVQGIRWYDVAVTGMEAHAGPTPMTMRKDALVAEDQQDDRQTDADLRSGDGDHEQGEDLAGHGAVERTERDQVDVHRIEDELDRHQDHHAVAARRAPRRRRCRTGPQLSRRNWTSSMGTPTPFSPRRWRRSARPTAGRRSPRRAR